MPEQLNENINNSYTTVLLPLTEDDKLFIKKRIKTYYQVNILLLPLLVIIFFWGLLYFLIFLTLVLFYNMFAFFNYEKSKQSLNNLKTVITGKITKKEPPDEEVIIFLGEERFDITYANVTFPIEVGDIVSIHYSQFDLKKRDILLKVKKENDQLG